MNAKGIATRVTPLTNFCTDNIDSKYFDDFDETVEVLPTERVKKVKNNMG